MIAVLLLDFGGPKTQKDVQPFLKNLFADPAIFPFPFGQDIFATIISKFRAPKVAKGYAKIGGGSPGPQQAFALVDELDRTFQQANLDIRMFVGMRYFEPYIENTLTEIAKLNPKGMLVVPMFPQYCTATTASVLTEFQRAYDALRLKIPAKIVDWWYDQPTYITGWCYLLQKALSQFDETIRNQVPILFSAHGLPLSFVTERKDPYPKQIKETCEKIMTYLGTENKAYIAYQSRVGPMEWLKPATIEFVPELAKKGNKNLVIAPISFLTDHIETLFEIDHEIIPEGKKCGFEKIVRCEALYHTPYLRKTLEELILKRLPSLL